MLTIKEATTKAVKLLKEKNIEDSNLKVKLILSFILNKPKEYIMIHEDDILNKIQETKYNQYIKKILKNEPLQYIIGKQEFMKLQFSVNKNVLIPRADTEILVEEIINICNKNNLTKQNILDLCTGSGAIGISLKKYLKDSIVVASDISTKALRVAKQNAINNNVDIKIVKSNLFKNIKQKFNIIVSNPPYIKTEVINLLSKEVQKEPKIALNGGKDGLEIYKQIINNASIYLEMNGFLALEIGYDQKDEVLNLIEKTNNYKNIYSKKDLANNDRIIICQKKEK